MSHIRVEVDGDIVFDRDVETVEGNESNGHFTMKADWTPEHRTEINLEGSLLGSVLDKALSLNPAERDEVKRLLDPNG